MKEFVMIILLCLIMVSCTSYDAIDNETPNVDTIQLKYIDTPIKINKHKNNMQHIISSNLVYA